MLRDGCPIAIDAESHEILPHGSGDFPCLGYDEVLGDRPGEDVAWHWHNDFEALVVVEGTMRVQVPGRSVLVREGDGLFLNVGVLHHMAGAPRVRLRSLVFSPTLVSGGMTSVFARKYVMPIVADRELGLVLLSSDDACARQIEHVERAISALEREDEDFEIEAREELTRLCRGIVESRTGTAPDPRRGADAERLRAMCDYVQAHLSEPIRVADIAGAAGVGEREGLRVFRRSMGSTPSSYLLFVRLGAAAAMLRAQPDLPVADVARSVGIADPSNFSRLFKGYYQVSPREYRKG